MQQPKVGVGVIVQKDGQFLLGKRIGSHGANRWAFPGGHLEYKETWEDCAHREVHEETGISICNLRFLTATNDILSKDDKHFVTVFLLADYKDGQVRLCEPERCEKWGWFSPDNLPTPLFEPIHTLFINHQPTELFDQV